ncbi:MAG: gliding motility protein GldC [Sphingobacteriales bacterium]|nr:gliding motility protein GldC [Sphingobacteriales bacterium]
MNKKNILFDISLDEQKVPEQIVWSASDSPVEEPQSCAAISLAMWDATAKTTMKFDLWTKEMTVEEMNFFIFQSLYTCADTLERATGNREEANALRHYAKAFAKRTKVVE